MDNGEDKLRASLNTTSTGVYDNAPNPSQNAANLVSSVVKPAPPPQDSGGLAGMAGSLVDSYANNPVSNAAMNFYTKNQSGIDRLNLLKQVQAITGLSTAQKQGYRNAVDQTVPKIKFPAGVDKIPVVQNLKNYGPYNSLIDPNAIPNAVASAAKLPAYMGPEQTVKDLVSILSGATQGAGLLDLGSAGINALTSPDSAKDLIGGEMHTPNIQQVVSDDPVTAEQAGQMTREATFPQADPNSFNRSVDSMTATPMDGQPLTPSAGYSNLQTQVTPVSQQINVGGGVSAPSQADPQASAYENALNTKNIPLLNQLMSLHPGDARFAVHKMLGW